MKDSHNDRIVRLLKNDASKRAYLKEYMKEYRRKKKEETGIGQKQYYDLDDIKRRSKESYEKKKVLCDIRFLFTE